MENKEAKEYIANIAKASAYFAFRNGPVKEMLDNEKLSKEDVQSIQKYMQNHLAYLYTVLLEENNLKKFELFLNTMNSFYINDDEQVLLADDGLENFYSSLFPKTSNITIK